MNAENLHEDALNLLFYLKAIWKWKILIVLIIIVSVTKTTISSLSLQNIYRAQAVITPLGGDSVGVGGGVILSPLFQQFVGLPGISTTGSSSAIEITNLLNSNMLKKKIIEKYDLMPVLFHEKWDAEKEEWKKGGGSSGFSFSLNPVKLVKRVLNMAARTAVKLFKPEEMKMPGNNDVDVDKDDGQPTMWDGIRALGIVRVSSDAMNNTLTVSADHHDPRMAVKMINYFLTTLKEHMSSENIREAEDNKAFLEERLKHTPDPFLRQKIYSMIAQQVETAMMASGKKNFAFKMFDPPMVPDTTIGPDRRKMVKFSFVVSLVAGVFIAFLIEYIRKAKAAGSKRG